MNRKLTLKILGQPDPTLPKDVHLVGRYALGVTWADDHGSIYPFEPLRRGCACGACGALASVTAPMVWPQEIKKVDGALRVVWADTHDSHYLYADLRALCRCAGCTGWH